MISYYSFTKVTRVKDFRWNEIFDEFAYFITRCPHFREHGTSRKVHHFSLCLSSSFFFISMPHAKTISRSLHSCWCCNSSARFTSFLHRQHWHLQLVAAPHMAFSVIQGEFLLAPDTLLSQGSACYMQTGFAKPRNWMLHFWQLSLPVVWKHSTQNPQKLVTAWCHHLCIENWIFLDSWRNLIKNMLIRKLQI